MPLSRATPSPFSVSILLGALLALATPSVFAGITYRLDRPAASPGDTIRIEAIFFNDSATGARWHMPAQIVLQWRGAQDKPIRSLARATQGAVERNIPVNHFARVSWEAVVPMQVRGLQAVAIEGEPVLMALDASGRESSSPVTALASVPVTDPGTGLPVPTADVAQAETAPPPFDPLRSAITSFEPVYFDIGMRERTTARFQLSAKYRLFTPNAGEKPGFGQNFYLGYTQTSLWDLEGDSKPFIDTTFNPSAFWLSDDLWRSPEQNWRVGLAAGIEHRSNGKAGDDSRSVNDAYIKPALNFRFDNGGTLTFAPKIMSYVSLGSENKDYAQYAGHVDWNLGYAQDNGVVVSAMYRQGDRKRRTTELDFAWPLQRTWLNMNGYLHLQYFNGYGETLLGYDQRGTSQFRIGLSLVP